MNFIRKGHKKTTTAYAIVVDFLKLILNFILLEYKLK